MEGCVPWRVSRCCYDTANVCCRWLNERAGLEPGCPSLLSDSHLLLWSLPRHGELSGFTCRRRVVMMVVSRNRATSYVPCPDPL